jgi:hypothetical protein
LGLPEVVNAAAMAMVSGLAKAFGEPNHTSLIAFFKPFLKNSVDYPCWFCLLRPKLKFTALLNNGDWNKAGFGWRCDREDVAP